MASKSLPESKESSSSPRIDAPPNPPVNTDPVAIAPENAQQVVAPAQAPAHLVAFGGADPADDVDDEGAEFHEESTDSKAPKRELTEDEKYIQEVRKKWRTMTDTELRETMAKPLGAAELVREASRMHEEQLQVIAPYMTDDQISSCIPSLQLQQQGALVQGFTAPQIRQCVRVIPQGDRQLLLQNITLITSSESDPSKSDEIQGLIGFIDPLAMAVAVERPELVEKVIQATSIMTPEQIRVMVPLLSVPQLRTTIETIVTTEGHAMAMLMMLPEQRTELVSQCKAELTEMETAVKKTLQVDISTIAEQRLPELSRLVHSFCNKPLTSLAAREHQVLSTKLISTKAQLEKCHREVRNWQQKLKLPLTLLNEGETEGPIRKMFVQLQEELTRLGKTVSQQYQILDNSGDSNTGLIHKLYDTWTRFQGDKGEHTAKPEEAAVTQEEQVYVDCDLSTALYMAVQAIGNPNTIGDIYAMSWNDIIDHGFRSAEDFASHGITNLKQLETYISTHKPKGKIVPASSHAIAEPAAAGQSTE